jgi:hypothetical protein
MIPAKIIQNAILVILHIGIPINLWVKQDRATQQSSNKLNLDIYYFSVSKSCSHKLGAEAFHSNIYMIAQIP